MTRTFVVILFCAATVPRVAEAEDNPHPPRHRRPPRHQSPQTPTSIRPRSRLTKGCCATSESRPQSSNRELELKTSRFLESLRSMNAAMPKSECLSPLARCVCSPRPGDQVRSGQLLVELQSPELGKLRAEYVSAQARLTLAEGALKRKRDLAAEKIAPQREVQEAETEFTQAQAALRSASAALTALGVPPSASGDTESNSAATFGLRSPVAGTVLERNIVQGQMLDPATPAFRIANLTTLWLTVHAFERDAVRVAKGANARLTFSALPGEQFRGVVTLDWRASRQGIPHDPNPDRRSQSTRPPSAGDVGKRRRAGRRRDQPGARGPRRCGSARSQRMVCVPAKGRCDV